MHTGRTVKRRASDVAMTLGATLYIYSTVRSPHTQTTGTAVDIYKSARSQRPGHFRLRLQTVHGVAWVGLDRDRALQLCGRGVARSAEAQARSMGSRSAAGTPSHPVGQLVRVVEDVHVSLAQSESQWECESARLGPSVQRGRAGEAGASPSDARSE